MRGAARGERAQGRFTITSHIRMTRAPVQTTSGGGGPRVRTTSPRRIDHRRPSRRPNRRWRAPGRVPRGARPRRRRRARVDSRARLPLRVGAKPLRRTLPRQLAQPAEARLPGACRPRPRRRRPRVLSLSRSPVKQVNINVYQVYIYVYTSVLNYRRNIFKCIHIPRCAPVRRGRVRAMPTARFLLSDSSDGVSPHSSSRDATRDLARPRVAR